MTIPLQKLVSFAEFVNWKPEGERYELHDGVIVKMPQPLGEHEEVIGFLVKKLSVELDKLNLSHFIPKTALVKPHGHESGYSPDVLIVDQTNLNNEPFWSKESTVMYGKSIPLIVEVVSTNWRDDYFTKLGKYEEMGIPEYWIVDYLALGGRKFIGSPKQPTISIYTLIEEEYQLTQFRGTEPIQSPTFPNLTLTAQQIFLAGKIVDS
ncbi:Uma2 family endonuclease [Fortiea contorta]|uniref:Uma2 family endonuclease n=1 Tax=Fortiea contorta TaxID=1892405 RepID=UPI0004772AA4|nr:Uma2 family endonuclease [Fortiea contorta]